MVQPQMDDEKVTAQDLRDAWMVLAPHERREGFQLLPQAEAEEFFLSLSSHGQAQLLLALAPQERRLWLRLLPPDDAADLLQIVPAERREGLLALLDESTRHEVVALLAYREDEAGGLMNPRFARLRPEITVEEALAYLRRQPRRVLETMYYAYVVDREQRLLGVTSVRELFAAPANSPVSSVMKTDFVSVPEDMDQEAVSRLFAERKLIAVPVLDADQRLKGIITVDDIVHVVQEEATEDIQKLGGAEALSVPYLDARLSEMVRKRAGWLTVLFLSEMLTATAMGFFQDEISRAVVLALFVPLIISSGGNSGSQASTLIIRSLALQELRLRDWGRVLRNEVTTGLVLGLVLGTIGFVRVVAWAFGFHMYGEHYLLVGATVATSLVGVVLWGTISGSMLPFVLRRVGLDPASASAPFVATLIDVTGLVIYFSVASLFLRGTLL